MSRGGNVLVTGAELARLAAAAGITPRHLYQIALGNDDKRPSWRTAATIERESGGRVTVSEVMPDVFEPESLKRNPGRGRAKAMK